MIVNHNKEKLINLIIYFVTKTRHCGKTKLFKLLYLADFRCVKETGRSITGLDYYAWKKGPVPLSLFNEMKKPNGDFISTFSIVKFDESDQLNIRPKHGKKFDDKHFTYFELKIIENISYIYKDALAKDMVEVTHLKNTPWDKTIMTKGLFKKIDYLLAFDDDKESLSIDEYRNRKEENDEIDKILS